MPAVSLAPPPFLSWGSVQSLTQETVVMALKDYEKSKDGIEMQLAANHVGHFLLTNLLMPQILAAGKGARIINVASFGYMSGGIYFDDPNFKVINQLPHGLFPTSVPPKQIIPEAASGDRYPAFAANIMETGRRGLQPLDGLLPVQNRQHPLRHRARRQARPQRRPRFLPQPRPYVPFRPPPTSPSSPPPLHH